MDSRQYSKWILWSLLFCSSVFCRLSTGLDRIETIAQTKHHTLIACEGDILNITCPTNQVINIIRANYGRFSLLECNDRSDTWEDFQCMYPKSTRVMEERCNNRTGCLVAASVHIFGDACINVSKYLEVRYSCISDTFDHANMLTRGSATSNSGMIANSQANSITPKEDTSNTQQKSRPSFCTETNRRSMQWPSTRVNYSAKLTCPNSDDEHLYAEWQCSADGTWATEYPDLSRCTSIWARDLEVRSRKIQKSEEASRIILQLQPETEASKNLYGGDIKKSVEIIRLITAAISNITETDPMVPTVKDETIQQFTWAVANVSNNLLQNPAPWLDLPSDTRIVVGDSLLWTLENISVLAATALNESVLNRNYTSPTIAIEISSLATTDQDFLQFPSSTFQSDNYDSIKIPNVAFSRPTSDSPIHTTVAIISIDPSLGEYLTPNADHKIDHGRSDHFDRRIVSRLLSINIIQRDPDTQLKQQSKIKNLMSPALLTFAINKVQENLSKATCVYWESSKRDWSSDGCITETENRTHVVCACNHLTTFAVLMDVYGVVLSAEHHLALLFITYIGCIVSIISCVLAIMAFCCFRASNHTDRISTHTNLCFCLFLAETTFLLGIDNSEFPTLCTTIAILLHYLFLAAFAWMLLEGVELYALLIEVFQPQHSRKRYFYLLGYGAPLVIVGISFLVDPESYGTRRHCWLSAENYFVYSFIGPVAVVLTANFLFLIMALVVMCRHTRYSSHRHNRERRSFMDNTWMWLKGAIILVILLGLTWTLGLLYVIHSTTFLAYSFTLLNSLQGLFIFVFHVVLNQQMRKDIQTRLLRQLADRKPSWMRTSNGSGDCKPTKVSTEDPSPMLLANSQSVASARIFGRLCNGGHYCQNDNNSVGPLVSTYHDPHIPSPDDITAPSEPLTDLSTCTVSSSKPPTSFSPSPSARPIAAPRHGSNVAVYSSKAHINEDAAVDDHLVQNCRLSNGIKQTQAEDEDLVDEMPSPIRF